MNSWTCTVCGGENPDGMRFCGHCGEAAPTEWSCSSCGGENAPEMRFCGHCGTPATSAAAAPVSAAPVASEVDETLRSFVATQVADRLVEAGGKLPEERRLITALFADVSGFTTLADRLDPEELLEIIDPVVSALSSIVGRYEGYVEKFAGDALLALFGAPVAHEDDAKRAVLVALEMHDELARVCRELGPNAGGLTLHVGVNSGHGIARVLGSAARMDYAVLGDSVILAQRLESAAPPGETYVSELTRGLTADEFEFEPVGELTLKGKLEAVPAFRLVGRRAVADLAPRFASRAPLVGRSEELSALEDALRGMLSGSGLVVTVVGEPGVGKSRLTAEARARARVDGTRWLDARCLSYGASLPYWPYAELLRSVAGIRAETEPGRAAEQLAATVSPVAPDSLPHFARLLDLASEAGDEADALEPEAFRRRLHEAFAAWLRSLAGDRPTVLVIDDFHWVDSSSLALTEDLVRSCADAPLTMYLTARTDGSAAAVAVAETAAAGFALSLDRLDEAGVLELVAGLLEGDPPPGLAAFVADRATGNPFFAGELVRSLQESGDVEHVGGRWRMRPGWSAETMPPTVEGLLASRIDQLPRASASLLGTVSVVGRRSPLRLLGAVEPDPSMFGEPLERLVASGFLERYEENGEPGVSFHHALVQDVAYGRLLRRRRRDLHRRVGEAAEALYGVGDETIDLLARHTYLGEAGAKAIDYLVRAGARGKSLFANDEAILHLTRAAEVARANEATAARLPEILLELADLHELVGGYGEALELYGELREARPDDVGAWRGLASTLRKQGEYERALGIVDEAFASPTLAGADLAPLWLEQGWTLAVSGHFDQAIDVLEAGLTAVGARRDGVIAQMLLQLTRAESVVGRVDEALRHGLEASDLFRQSGDRRGMAVASRVLGDVYRLLEQLDEAAAHLRGGLELAERVGSVEEIGGSLLNLGMLELERGRTDDAAEYTRRAIDEFERVGIGAGRAQGHANLAWILSQAGDYEEALGEAHAALSAARAIGHTLVVADTLDTVATIELKRGRYETAAERAEESVALYLEVGAAPKARVTLGVAANAWELAGQAEKARSVRERALSLTSR